MNIKYVQQQIKRNLFYLEISRLLFLALFIVHFQSSYHLLQMSIKKNIVVTGGNIGIGYQTVKGLYHDNHNIIFGSRNQTRNKEATDQIKLQDTSSTGSLKNCKLDLSKKQSIEQFVNFIQKEFDHIDILINNAGMIMNDRQLNQMGVQMMMAVNHFGHFYLTYLLFPQIKKSKEARILNVSSLAHFSCKFSTSQDLDSSQNFGSLRDYQKSKLANVQFSFGLSERLSKYPYIKAASLHPGIVASQFGYTISPGLMKCIHCLCCCMYVSNETGARTSLYLSRIQFSQIKSGQYYHSDTALKEMNELGRDRNEIDKLWRVGQKLYGIQFSI